MRKRSAARAIVLGVLVLTVMVGAAWQREARRRSQFFEKRTLQIEGYTLEVVDCYQSGFYSGMRSSNRWVGFFRKMFHLGERRKVGVSLRMDIAGHTREDLLLVEGVKNLHGQDDQGKTVRIQDMPVRIMEVLPPIQKDNPAQEMVTFMEEERAQSFQTLEGDLLAYNGVVHQIEFVGEEIKTGNSKQIGKVSVKLDAVSETGRLYTVSASCETPYFTPVYFTTTNSMWGGFSERCLVSQLVVGDNSIYYPGSRQSAIFYNPDLHTSETRQTVAFVKPVAGRRRLVFRVLEQTGPTRTIPFKFNDISIRAGR